MRFCYLEKYDGSGYAVTLYGKIIAWGKTKSVATQNATEVMEEKFMDDKYELIDCETAIVKVVKMNV